MKTDSITILSLKGHNKNLNRARAIALIKPQIKRKEIEVPNEMRDSMEHLEISIGLLRERSKEEILGNLRIVLRSDAHDLQLLHWRFLYYS